jgi:hypothetical protein
LPVDFRSRHFAFRGLAREPPRSFLPVGSHLARNPAGVSCLPLQSNADNRPILPKDHLVRKLEFKETSNLDMASCKKMNLNADLLDQFEKALPADWSGGCLTPGGLASQARPWTERKRGKRLDGRPPESKHLKRK